MLHFRLQGAGSQAGTGEPLNDIESGSVDLELILLSLRCLLPFCLTAVLLTRGLFVSLEDIGNRIAGWNYIVDEGDDVLLASVRAKKAAKARKKAAEAQNARHPRKYVLILALAALTISFAVDGAAMLFMSHMRAESLDDEAYIWPTFVSLIDYTILMVIASTTRTEDITAGMVLKIAAGTSLVLCLPTFALSVACFISLPVKTGIFALWLSMTIVRVLASMALTAAYHPQMGQAVNLQSAKDSIESTPLLGHTDDQTQAPATATPANGLSSSEDTAGADIDRNIIDAIGDDDDDDDEDPEKIRAYDLPAILSRVSRLLPHMVPLHSRLAQFLILVCVALTLASNVAGILLPRQLGLVVDDLGAGRAPWRNLLIWALLRASISSGGLVQILKRALWNPVSQLVDRSVDTTAFAHVLELGMRYHHNKKTGELLAALSRAASISSVLNFLVFYIIPIFLNIGGSLAYLAAKFGASIICVVAGTMICYMAVVLISRGPTAKLRAEYVERSDNTAAIKNESISNVELLKYFGMEQYEISRYSKSLLRTQRADWDEDLTIYAVNLTEELVQVAGTVAGALLIARTIYIEGKALGLFVSFMAYIDSILSGLDQLQWMSHYATDMLTSTDKLVKILDEKNDIMDLPDAEELYACKGDIEFKNVTMIYEPVESKKKLTQVPRKALDDVSFSIKAGQHIALVGETGAGKSTVFKLLFRFFEPASGTITLDGKDIRSYTQLSLRKALGIVQQEGSVFNDTIFANIKYGDITAPDGKVFEAAKMANIHDRISDWPKAYQTVVGERGVKLSGGEKQRVNIARTILKNPNVLLLDEATSALDSNTEKAIQTQLRQITRGKTTLAIAHRLSTIAQADKILVLEKGKIVESGTHEELLQIEGGHYRKLWETQTSSGKSTLDEQPSMEKAGESLDAATTE